MKALFVHDATDLDAPVPGGVQLCSREFLAIVRTAAAAVQPLAISNSRAPVLRLRRRLKWGSYLGYDAGALRATLADAVRELGPTHVFLNRAELIRLAPLVKQLSPATQVIVLSHGNQSGDDLYEIAGPAGRHSDGTGWFGATWKLGQDLVTEARHRHRWIDAVAVMSAEEAVLERWLGARRTVVLPRLISAHPLPWQPVPARCGYVGTLDHTPNRIALERVCAELDTAGTGSLELRVVGSPALQGEAIARRFPFVKYLGRLGDDALRAEASTWNVFLNPILWLSRGASMKLGVALGWGLPVLTTRTGARGYEWSDGNIPTCSDDASVFASELKGLLHDRAALAAAKSASERAAASAPSLQELAERLRAAVA